MRPIDVLAAFVLSAGIIAITILAVIGAEDLAHGMEVCT